MKRAIYPGSFDPITNGHVDIVKRARSIFDEVTIAVAQNKDKQALFSIDERQTHIKSIFDNNDGIFVDSFSGLLVDYAKRNNVTTIIRGLRAVSDFEFEFQMSLTNRSLDNEIDTVFLMTDAKYSYLSSSLVKEVTYLKGDIGQFVPDVVYQELCKKLQT